MNDNVTLGTGDSFTSVLSSLKNQRRRIDVIGTNISNINTVGYKSSRMTFLEMMGQTVGKLYTPFEQGQFTATGSPTDIAIEGRSFFVIRNGDNYEYTRAGAFFFDSDGRLVNQNRQSVQGWLVNSLVDEEHTNTSFNSVDVGAIGAIGDILLDPEMTVGAIATKNVYLGGNINAGLQAIAQMITSTDTMRYESGGIVLNADGTTEINDLVQVSTDLVDGDVINIGGTDSAGNALATVAFTYGAGNDGTTLQDFINRMNDAFAGEASVSLVDGKIILTDDLAGDTKTSISLSAAASNTGTIVLPTFQTSTEGYTPRYSTSVIVYDSLGTAHHITFEFEKTTNNREWAWEAMTDDGATITSGGSGKIVFDAEGNYISNTFDDGTGSLVTSFDNGANDLDMVIHAGGADGLSPLTYYDSLSTISARSQDGQASGDMESVKIDEEGYILGTFTNGVIVRLAQVALAEFDDPASLGKVGTSNFLPTNWSGDANIGRASDFKTNLLNGHLETSNVDLADQFIQLLDAQKAYSASSRIVSTLDRVLEETTAFGR
ncbi:MAG TPA: flagellar hook-basal body complex protein [Candidatus Marinimicrobia bacterium]|nr:flagellar hook-basal body complex protein [Candidatus Neomarinimicrobiota bacterium]